MTSIVKQGSSLGSCPTFLFLNLHYNRLSDHWPCVKSCLMGGRDKYRVSVKISQNTKSSPGEIRKFAVPKAAIKKTKKTTDVKNLHRLKIVIVISKEWENFFPINLYSRNLIKSINTSLVFLIRHSRLFLKWTKEKLLLINEMTENVMMYMALHQRDDID